MNKTKRILALVLAVVMMFSAVPLSAIAYTTDDTTDDTAAPTYTESATGDISNIYANGTSIVLDKDPTDNKIYLWDEAGNKLSEYPVRDNTSVYGTSKDGGKYSNVKITIKAGNFSMVYATANASVSSKEVEVGNAEINLEGGSVKNLGAGMGAYAAVTEAVLNISGGEIATCVSPGSNPKLVENVTINITGGTVAAVYAASQANSSSNPYTGNTTVNITGGTVSAIYGGTKTTGTAYAQADIKLNVEDTATVNAIYAMQGLVADSSVALSVGENFDLTKVTDADKIKISIGTDMLVNAVDCGVSNYTLTAAIGQELSEVEGLPSQITYTLTDGSIVNVAASWDDTDYNSSVAKTYKVKLLPTTGYVWADGVTAPEFTITVARNYSLYVKEITAPEVIEVAYLTEEADINWPLSLAVIGDRTAEGGEVTYDTEDEITGVEWVCDNYDSAIVGEYEFKAVLPETEGLTYAKDFDITLTVKVLETTEPKIVDLGWYPNDVKIPVGTLTEFVTPKSAEVTLEDDTTAVINFLEWAITDEEGNPVDEMDLTQTGVYYYTPSFRSAHYPIEGVSFTMRVEVTETQISYVKEGAVNSLILEGIPAVINTDANGEGTYAYDATGMNLIYSENISGWRVYGGTYSKEKEVIGGTQTGNYAKSSIESASIVMLGGELDHLTGGSGVYVQNAYPATATAKRYSSTTKNVTLKIYGGTIDQVYPAGNGAGMLNFATDYHAYAENVDFRMYDGEIKTRLALLGWNSIVTNTATATLEGGKIADFYSGSYSVYADAKNSAYVNIYVGEEVEISHYYSLGRISTVSKISHYIPKDNNIKNLAMYDTTDSAQGTEEGVYFYFDSAEQIDKLDKPDSPGGEAYFYIDGQKLMIVSDLRIEPAEYEVEYGTALEDIGLPTSFAVGQSVVSGFSWVGTYNSTKAGTYTLTLEAPSYVYLTSDLTITVRVKKLPSNIINNITTETATLNVDNGTAVEDVIAALPEEFKADGKTIKNTVFEWVYDEYASYNPGTYTFYAQFTDDDYKYADGVEEFKAEVTVGAPTGDGMILTMIDVPVNYTVFTPTAASYTLREGTGTTTSIVTLTPTFYDTLDAVVYENGERKVVKLTNVTWTGKATEKTDAYGTYWEYTIDTFAESDQYNLSDAVLEASSIKVLKLSSAAYNSASGNFCSTSTVIIPVVVSTMGFEAFVGTSYKGYAGMSVMDATGCNPINRNVNISNGGIYYGGANQPVVGDPSVTIAEGAIVDKVYGGGHLSSVRGNATINLKKGSTANDVYAGSNTAEFIGNTTINVESGATVNNTIYACGLDGLYFGDVVINVESGANIGGISLGDIEAYYPNSLTVNVSSDFDLSLIEGIETGKIRVFVDGVEQLYVTEIDFGDIRVEVENGEVTDYTTRLPDVYVTIGGNKIKVPETDYTWTTDNFDGNTAGEYIYVLDFDDRYQFLNDSQYHNILTVYVKINPNDYQKVTEITTDIVPSVTVPYGTPIDKVYITNIIEGYVYRVSDQTETDATLNKISGITWSSTNYNPNKEAKYTFTMVLPDGYVTDLALPTVEVEVLKVDNPTIVSFNVPERETYFTKGVVTNPVFYDTLEANVIYNGSTDTVKMSGLKWYCTSTYNASTVGTYTFKIDASSIDSNKYIIKDDVINEAAIKVNVIDAIFQNNYGRYKTKTATIIPTQIKEWVDDSYGAGAYDLTGCNLIYTTGNTTSARILGGAGYSIPATAGQKARVNMTGGTLTDVIGGSYGTNFIGDAELSFSGTSTVTKVIAGTINNGFTGNTSIKIGGEAAISTIVAGSPYDEASHTSSTSGVIVGNKAATAYNGTVTITIEDDFAGSINTIERSNSNKLILNCPADFKYEAYVDLSDPTVEVYVDGVRVLNVSSVEVPSTTIYNVGLGTKTDEIGLPEILEATVNGEASTVDNITWVCENYDANTAGKYIFTPVIPEDYLINTDDIDAIEITVRVLTANAGTSQITAFNGINTIKVPYGMEESEIVLPDTVKATVNGQTVDVEIDKWVCANYDGNVLGAQYTYTGTVSAEYVLADGVADPTVTVTIDKAVITEVYVPVTQTTFPMGAVETPVFYDTLSVKLSDGTVLDVSGFEWSVNGYNKDQRGTCTANIKATPANYTFASGINLPSITITVTNYTFDTTTTDKTIYLFGIPTVINGNDTETYIYDATGCNKTYAQNITGYSVFGGVSEDGPTLRTTNITVLGGNLNYFYGGSSTRTKITESTYVYVYGGKFAHLYGGGRSFDRAAANIAVTQNTYTYVENATVTTRAGAAGLVDSVLGNATLIIKNSTFGEVYAGCYTSAITCPVLGTATVKLLDGAIVRVLAGTGRASYVHRSELYLSKNATVKTGVYPLRHSTTEEGVYIYFETGFDISNIYTEEPSVRLFEGHFLEDRETFVEEREITIIRNAALPSGEVYVDYGTTLENIGLPTSVEGDIENFTETVEGVTYTPVHNYNGNVPGKYEFKLEIPDGYAITPFIAEKVNTVTVVVLEVDNGGTVTSIEGENREYTFANGTPMEHFTLPTSYTVRLSTGAQKTLPVKNWTVTDENGKPVTYDRKTAGTYVFTPVFDSKYTVAFSAVKPTFIAKILECAPYTTLISGRTLQFLVGVPSESNLVNGMTEVRDKVGNLLILIGNQTTVYSGTNVNDGGVESTDFTVNTGSYYALYAGCRYTDVNGTAKLVINGGTITYLRGAPASTVQGTEFYLNGGSITHVYPSYGFTNNGQVYVELNGSTIRQVVLGNSVADSAILGMPQEEDEEFAKSSINYPDQPIVCKKGENVGVVFVQNGGTITSGIYGGGTAANTRNDGSVKMYFKGGTTNAVYGTGTVTTSSIVGNVYIYVTENASVGTITPVNVGTLTGTAYVIIPASYNRYDIIGWEEKGSGGSTGDDYGSSEDITRNIVVSGGYYEEGIPVRIAMSGATQVLYARGVPIRIIGEPDAGGVYTTLEEYQSIPTYAWYFDTEYDAETETPETFTYETYVDENGQPYELTGVWRKLETQLSTNVMIVGGGFLPTSTDLYASTYVEYQSGYVNNIYAGGMNNTERTANLVLNQTDAGYINTYIYGGGNKTASTRTNNVNIEVRKGTYNYIFAGGNVVTTTKVNVDIKGGTVHNLYLGTYADTGVVGGTATLNLENCTVGNIYGGGYVNTGSYGALVYGPVYINVNEGVKLTGKMYPIGKGENADKTTSGPVNSVAYVNLNDSAKVVEHFKAITFNAADGYKIYVNGVALGTPPKYTMAPFDNIAEKKVEVTQAPGSTTTTIFLNGIPTIVAGDGNGKSFLYQAKTKDGTLDVYQKNADGTLKLDENGKKISNIVRDPVTGQAIKGPKLVDVDTLGSTLYGGAMNKSVENVYVEFQNGGSVYNFTGGCQGGNVGYDKNGNEVGLVEVRFFDGSVFYDSFMGNTLGTNITGQNAVNVRLTRVVVIGVDGTPGSELVMGGDAGIVGSKDNFLKGYYNKAGEKVTYTDPDDGQIYHVTGIWEDYNLDATKEDYEAYYRSSNAYFNGEDNTKFLDNPYYVDPYDDHYTIYCVLSTNAQNIFTGTKANVYDESLNRVYGNQYIRQTAYGLKYDAELDMFVDDYNEYRGLEAVATKAYGGSQRGACYNDVRMDMEGITYLTELDPLGRSAYASLNYGHTYLNLFTTDTLKYRELYNKVLMKDSPQVTIRENFYPLWSMASAWALDVGMAQEAMNRGYITGIKDPKEARIDMLTAENAAALLNYYLTGTDIFPDDSNVEEFEGYQRVMDASDDKGKFTIRNLECRLGDAEGMNKYIASKVEKSGDLFIITFPNGQIMLVDFGVAGVTSKYLRDVNNYLQSAKEAGIGDGKTIDYLLITHWHSDHYGCMPAAINAFDIKTIITTPYQIPWNAGYSEVENAIKAKNAKYAKEGKPEIEIIRPIRDTVLTIGEGDQAVEMYVMGPGDNVYSTYSLEKLIYVTEVEQSYGTGLANSLSICVRFTYQGQRFITCGDAYISTEQSIYRTYGADFLDCEVLKLNHHGVRTSNDYKWLNTCNPDITFQTILELGNPETIVIEKWIGQNNTGNYAETNFKNGIHGITKIVMDGEKVTADTQYRPYEYERDTDEYKELDSSYAELLDDVLELRDSLTVVADNGTAPYGTPYIWKSYANYIDGQLEELSKRYYTGLMTIDMLEDYSAKLSDLDEFIDASVMTGGSDTTPDVTVPGTESGSTGSESGSTAGGTTGGIMGDVGGGNAGGGIGGGAAVGGAPGGGETGGETTDPVTPTPDVSDRRFIDVATTDWFNNAVNYVADNNYFQGVSENEFDPNGKMTRAMLVTVIGRMAKADTANAKNEFADVEAGSWYAEYVAWAAENGIVTGVGENKFAPNTNVTREQIAAILMRFATHKGLPTSVSTTEKYDSMKDTASVSEYAVEALKWATAYGVINGADGNINPKGNATRAEVAQMIMNFCNTFTI